MLPCHPWNARGDAIIMGHTSIEWADNNHNWMRPACSKVSPGCAGCYSERSAKRNGQNFADIGLKSNSMEVIQEPLHWRKPKRTFVNSMSDTFHEQFETHLAMQQARNAAFDVYDKASNHVFILLTKRPHLMAKFMQERYGEKGVPDHIFVGTSIESEKYLFRADILREIRARHRLLSIEPLLGLIINPNLQGISWVIVGGESAPKMYGIPSPRPRPMRKEWVIEILKACREQNVSFFFKQWGSLNGDYSVKCECHGAWGCRLLNDKTYDEFPIEWPPVPKSDNMSLEMFA